jgi:transcriptional regulator with XRE-family HTH domain
MVGMDRDGLADFLRRRREALQPADAGLPAGRRRRTAGLRREEVAALAGMSVDYYARLEQQRGPQPSEQMIAAIARALRLNLDQRDHLFRLAGHTAPMRVRRAEHVNTGLMRVLDRLNDTPAMVVSDLNEALVQNPMAIALLGDQADYTGPARSAWYRWFTDPDARRIYPERDHAHQNRVQAASLRAALSAGDPDRRAASLVELLLGNSDEFAQVWQAHEVGLPIDGQKTLVHPELGEITVDCQILWSENRAQSLLVFTARPGTVDYDKIAMLPVVGHAQFTN